ncbi:MAG TPA: hypothetical protein VF046_02200 [Gemmatimonadales bacterium]
MLRSATLLAGTILLAASPLAAQAGLLSSGASVSLTAVRQSSISLGLVEPADDSTAAAVWTAWNIDRDESGPLAVVAFVEPPRLASARGATGIRPIEVLGRPPAEAFLLFRQSTPPDRGRGTRTEMLELRRGAGTLNLMVFTQ